MIDILKPYSAQLTWSASRDGTLRECERKYFLHYYAGLVDDEVKFLKGLSNRYFWTGNLVHDFCEQWVKRGLPPPKSEAEITAEIRKLTHGQMPQDWAFSEAKTKKFRLSEHEYRVRVSKDEKREMMEIVSDSVREFLTGPVLADLQLPKRRVHSTEELTSYKVDGVKVWVKLDLAYWQGDVLRIVDWKTGKTHKNNALQIASYAAWAIDTGLVKGPEQIETVAAYLRLKKYDIQHPTAADIEDAKARIRSSIKDMKAKVQPDGTAKAEDFPQLNAWPCKRCNFQRVCWPAGWDAPQRKAEAKQEILAELEAA